MVRSIHPSSFAVHERQCMARTAKRAGVAAMLGLALLAAPLGPTSPASTVRTSPHLLMACDGPRWLNGGYPNPGGYNGRFYPTINACDSAEYFQTELHYSFSGGYWHICDENQATSAESCNPFPGASSDGQCSPTPCYGGGLVYMQSQMDSDVQIGSARDVEGPF